MKLLYTHENKKFTIVYDSMHYSERLHLAKTISWLHLNKVKFILCDNVTANELTGGAQDDQ